MPKLVAPTDQSKGSKYEQQNHSSTTVYYKIKAYLCKWEANHEKLFIFRIQEKVNQKNCIGIIAKILENKACSTLDKKYVPP